MKNLYVDIWMTQIQLRKDNRDPKISDGWKKTVWFILSSFNTMNYVSIVFLLKYIFNVQYSLADYIGIDRISSGLAGFFDYMLPFLLLSYFCFFYKDRYKKYIPKYKVNRKLNNIYGLISLVLFFVTLIIMANR